MARMERKRNRRARRMRKRKRMRSQMELGEEEILAHVAAGLARRSFSGLVDFLVAYFRCLFRREAIRYLRLARADLAVAVRLIEHDREIPSSPSSELTTTATVALKCAALSARHPTPAALVSTWLSLASHPDKLSLPPLQRLLGGVPSPVGIGYLHKPLQVETVQLHRWRRMRQARKKKEVPVELTRSLSTRLFDMIQCCYLKAIRRLPRDALRSRHHRGLLKAGLCLGPMDDPVSNILLNTVWYDAAFPAEKELVVDMLCTKSLARVVHRSSAALIAFLCTLFLDLSRHDAILYLLQAGASLKDAISRAKMNGHHDASKSLKDAYMAAALIAWHPDHEALVELYMSTVPSVSPAALSLLRTSTAPTLSYTDVDLVSASLARPRSSSCRQSAQQVEELTSRALHKLSRYQRSFAHDQNRFRQMVEAALEEFSKQSGGPEYELHIICGVNAQVAENGKQGYYYIVRGYPYCHINFLASPRGSDSLASTTAPTLFFAECSNNDKKALCCYVVDQSQYAAGRCYNCEHKGTKIVHPAFGTYRGCNIEFEERACSEYLCTDNIMRYDTSYDMLASNPMGWLLDDDCVYFDPRWDFKFTKYINEFAEYEANNPPFPIENMLKKQLSASIAVK